MDFDCKHMTFIMTSMTFTMTSIVLESECGNGKGEIRAP